LKRAVEAAWGVPLTTLLVESGHDIRTVPEFSQSCPSALGFGLEGRAPEADRSAGVRSPMKITRIEKVEVAGPQMRRRRDRPTSGAAFPF
jgi:hypothetical protein